MHATVKIDLFSWRSFAFNSRVGIDGAGPMCNIETEKLCNCFYSIWETKNLDDIARARSKRNEIEDKYV